MTTNLHGVAVDLHQRGWNPLPLPANAKNPPPEGFTGYRGRTPTTADITKWDWNGNIAIRLPPDIIGIDVDAYKGGTIDPFEEAHGELPATYWSTSRDDGSGIAYFRVPTGTTLRANPATGVEIIQHGHRYSVAPPSTHPKTGDQYRWIDETTGDELDTAPDIDDLPELPWAWIEALRTVKNATTAAASGDEVAEFIVEHTAATGVDNGKLRGLRTRLENYSGSRHDTLVEVACWAMRETAADLYPANLAIIELESWWNRVMDDRARLDSNEFGDVIRWAVAQASLEPERVEKLRQESAQNAAQPPANVDPATGEAANFEHLPDDFWNARPELAHIRQAAHSRLVSADATLIAVLSRVVALIPPNVVIPAIVGGNVSLNLFGSIVDPSGGGKSASVSVARQLVPIIRDDIVDPILPSSGEGLIEAFMGTDETTGDDGKKRKERRQVHRAGFAWVDEGQGLLAQADRSGSTIMETIRSAWMGGDLGQHNASEDRKRWLGEHRYRLCMVIGFQLAYAAHLIGDNEGGTPQRFTFALGTDPTIDPNAAWTGPLELERWPVVGGGSLIDIDVDAEVAKGIKSRRLARSRGELIVDPLDTHQDLRRLKLAAAFGALERRQEINAEDWELACELDDTSCAVRTKAIDVNRRRREAEHQTGLRLAVERAQAVDSATVRKATEGACRSISRRVWREGPMTLGAAWRMVSSRHRENTDEHDALALAIERGWLVERDGEMSRGANDPR